MVTWLASHVTHRRSMAPRKNAAKPKGQQALSNAGFWPMLTKTNAAVGKYCSVPGKFWDRCAAADKEKRYKCIVIDFVAVHDFGDGRKGSAFKLKEMGEDGRGSLEPGFDEALGSAGIDPASASVDPL